MELTERDKSILKDIVKFGFMTTYQVSMLYEWHLKICQRRLRMFVKHGYLKSIPIPAARQGGLYKLFYPGKKSEEIFNIQSSKPRLNWKTTHAIKNIDILIQAVLVCKKINLECNLLPEHIMRQSGQNIIPDGVFNLRRNGKSALFFIENDSGTEIIKSTSFNNEDLENKIIRYIELFEENKVAYYNQFFSQQFNRFRVLFITNDINRLLSISTLLTDPKHHFIWLTTLPEFNKNPLGNIWSVPAINEYNLSII
jgi:hypothetical protein